MRQGPVETTGEEICWRAGGRERIEAVAQGRAVVRVARRLGERGVERQPSLVPIGCAGTRRLGQCAASYGPRRACRGRRPPQDAAAVRALAADIDGTTCVRERERHPAGKPIDGGPGRAVRTVPDGSPLRPRSGRPQPVRRRGQGGGLPVVARRDDAHAVVAVAPPHGGAVRLAEEGRRGCRPAQPSRGRDGRPATPATARPARRSSGGGAAGRFPAACPPPGRRRSRVP